MTNAESYLQIAKKAFDANLLNESEQKLIGSLKNHTKKQLDKLSSSQYHRLRDIGRKYSYLNAPPLDLKNEFFETNVKPLILDELNKIVYDPIDCAHFKLVNWSGKGEAQDIDTEYIPLNKESAQVLIDFLRTKFPTLK